MRRFIGVICMLLGLALCFGAAGLYVYNRAEDIAAGDVASQYLPHILELIPENKTPENSVPSSPNNGNSEAPIPEDAHDKLNSYVSNMLVTQVEGYDFVGYISIPRLEIALPVLSETSDSALKKFPCRFSGSPKTNNLVVGAHNYENHFGRIDELSQGDVILFTDMEGNVWQYAVSYSEILSPEDVEPLKGSGFPLTLYTCNYDGSKRITLRCEIAK